MKKFIVNTYVFDLILFFIVTVSVYLWYNSTSIITERTSGRVIENESLSIKTVIEYGTKRDIILRKLYVE